VEEVVLEYQATWEEFRRGQMRAIPNKGLAVMALITLGAILLGLTSKDSFWIYYGVAFAILFFLMAVVFGPRRAWNAGIGFQEPRKVTINDKGVVSKSNSLEMKLEWSRFRYVRESKDLFLLMPKKKMSGFMIVKRGLASASDERALRHILERHLTVRRMIP
jgi:YcxB-like protein